MTCMPSFFLSLSHSLFLTLHNSWEFFCHFRLNAVSCSFSFFLSLSGYSLSIYFSLSPQAKGHCPLQKYGVLLVYICLSLGQSSFVCLLLTTTADRGSPSFYIFSLPNRLFFMLASVKKSLFFTAEITFFHAAASSVKKSDSSVKKSSSSVKKSTFFHAEKVMKSRIWMFRGGWELISPT
jgi:hypothetical protein